MVIVHEVHSAQLMDIRALNTKLASLAKRTNFIAIVQNKPYEINTSQFFHG